MAIRFHPRELAKRLAPTKTVQKLVSNKLTLNRATLNMLSNQDFLKKSTMEDIALKVIKGYKKRYAAEIEDGATKAEALDEAVNGRKQMVQRVQGAITNEISSQVKDFYNGEYYIWLPSDADEPDALHQLNYGKKFLLGIGEAPGDRYGCQCGMQILVPETKLDL